MENNITFIIKLKAFLWISVLINVDLDPTKNPGYSGWMNVACSLYEAHIQDTVEGQSSCIEIHIHSYSRAAGGNRHCNIYIYYHASISIQRESRTNTRTDHYVQTHTQNQFLSCRCSYMRLWYRRISHSTPAPSNSIHTLSLHNTCSSQSNLSGWAGYSWTVFPSDRRRRLFTVFRSRVNPQRSNGDETYNIICTWFSNAWNSMQWSTHK